MLSVINIVLKLVYKDFTLIIIFNIALIREIVLKELYS